MSSLSGKSGPCAQHSVRPDQLLRVDGINSKVGAHHRPAAYPVTRPRDKSSRLLSGMDEHAPRRASPLPLGSRAGMADGGSWQGALAARRRGRKPLQSTLCLLSGFVSTQRGRAWSAGSDRGIYATEKRLSMISITAASASDSSTSRAAEGSLIVPAAVPMNSPSRSIAAHQVAGGPHRTSTR